MRTATAEDRESDSERVVKVDGGGRGVAGQSELRAWLEEAASLVVVIGAVESSRAGSCWGIEVVAGCRGAEVFAASSEVIACGFGEWEGRVRTGGVGSGGEGVVARGLCACGGQIEDWLRVKAVAAYERVIGG